MGAKRLENAEIHPFLEVETNMARQARLCCTWSVLFFFLFTFLIPREALCFDTDTLKTAGIVSGITIGVALIVVLIVGTVRDMKRGKDKDNEDDDVWTQSPVLRTLGYGHMDDPLFGRPSACDEGLEGGRQIEAFLEGRIDRIPFEGPRGPCRTDPGCFRLGGVPTGFSLARPAAPRQETRPAFSLWRAGSRSCGIEGETGGTPGTT